MLSFSVIAILFALIFKILPDVSSQIFFFGAELTRSYAERRGRGKLPAPTEGAVLVTTVIKPKARVSRPS